MIHSITHPSPSDIILWETMAVDLVITDFAWGFLRPFLNSVKLKDCTVNPIFLQQNGVDSMSQVIYVSITQFVVFCCASLGSLGLKGESFYVYFRGKLYNVSHVFVCDVQKPLYFTPAGSLSSEFRSVQYKLKHNHHQAFCIMVWIHIALILHFLSSAF
jgi:hypothetical protein